jgi:hypothetical protein
VARSDGSDASGLSGTARWRRRNSAACDEFATLLKARRQAMSRAILLPPSGVLPDKIQRRHRERVAMVYIRQSTPGKSNGIRNRRGCNMRSSIAPSSSVGRARILSSSTTISGALARASKALRLSTTCRRSWLRPCRAGAGRGDVAFGAFVTGISCWRSARYSTL